MEKNNLSRETQILQYGARIHGRRIDIPETVPIYLTTAFTVPDLDEVAALYRDKGYAYIRTRNPNRNSLADLMTYLENGESSLICTSGMAAISTTLFSMLEDGDHILSNCTLYGETLELLNKHLPKYGIEVTIVDFTNLEEIKNDIKPNTKIVYTEIISNPMITVVNIEDIAKISNDNNAKFVVDNTFATSLVIRPLEFGADVVINSLTKFANGHSDVCAGSITASVNKLLIMHITYKFYLAVR
ncbi:aminotransferase class I/II-fold pyridoxal phosphate-dependent enzyme [uncultured Desulfosarcina sp.]|uniref:aminotransferase class I/II-fold pyridoxal phosphate-dependent enzyme n=1 Tax=uncultured Desulfosarcina sp. TaxID=218289 RepID=UPI0029C65638|nr:aminotransferase class I/II-fold pyridoxal phosphate-dependent enzyme [uncultured Desulfosarcina sp.]